MAAETKEYREMIIGRCEIYAYFCTDAQAVEFDVIDTLNFDEVSFKGLEQLKELHKILGEVIETAEKHS